MGESTVTLLQFGQVKRSRRQLNTNVAKTRLRTVSQSEYEVDLKATLLTVQHLGTPSIWTITQ